MINLFSTQGTVFKGGQREGERGGCVGKRVTNEKVRACTSTCKEGRRELLVTHSLLGSLHSRILNPRSPSRRVRSLSHSISSW